MSINIYIKLFIPFCDCFLILRSTFCSTDYGTSFRFKSVRNSVLCLVSILGRSGAVPSITRIHSCFPLVQVYCTSFTYLPLIIFGIIMLYLLLKINKCWRNMQSNFRIREIRQPHKTLGIVSSLAWREMFDNVTQLTCLEITGFPIKYSTVQWYDF